MPSRFWTWCPTSCAMTYACAKSPGALEPVLQVAVEREVDVELLVGGAVERPDRRLRVAARRLHLPGEEHERRLAVGPAAAREDVGPDLLGRAEHGGDEVGHLVVARRRFRLDRAAAARARGRRRTSRSAGSGSGRRRGTSRSARSRRSRCRRRRRRVPPTCRGGPRCSSCAPGLRCAWRSPGMMRRAEYSQVARRDRRSRCSPAPRSALACATQRRPTSPPCARATGRPRACSSIGTASRCTSCAPTRRGGGSSGCRSSACRRHSWRR